MSNVGIEPGQQAACARPASDVALIADASVTERIAATLELQQLSFSAFVDADALIQDSSPMASTIVLSINNAATGLTAQIEPLASVLATVPLIVIGSGIERRGVRSALSAGTAVIVLMHDLESALGPCIQAVLAGQTCVPRGHWREIDPPALSSREKQILGLVVMGFMNSQIAEQLFLAESTVKSHLSSAFSKLGVRSRNEAVNLILDPQRGLGTGILSLVGDVASPTETASPAAQ